MNQEKKKLIHALIVPLILLFIMWGIRLIELGFDIRLTFLGVHLLYAD